MGPTSGFRGAPRRCGGASIGCFLVPKTLDREIFSPFPNSFGRRVLGSPRGPGPARRSVSHRTVSRVYSWLMREEGAVLEELMGRLGEASKGIRAARRILAERASEDDPAHLRLLARLSEALDATEAASREARRQRRIG